MLNQKQILALKILSKLVMSCCFVDLNDCLDKLWCHGKY